MQLHVRFLQDSTFCFADISWGTVGVAWTLTTVTTVLIVFIALKLRGVLKKKRSSKQPAGTNCDVSNFLKNFSHLLLR